MGIAPSVDSPSSSTDSPTGMIDEQIGKVYNDVQKVAEHIEGIQDVADNIDVLLPIVDQVDDIVAAKQAAQAAAQTAQTASTSAGDSAIQATSAANASAASAGAADTSADEAAASAASAQAVLDTLEASGEVISVDGRSGAVNLSDRYLALTGGSLTGNLNLMGVFTLNGAALNAANGLLQLDGSSLVPAGLLPSYVDDVLEFANFAAMPTPGVGGKIYITTDTNPARQWRWTGTAYQQMVASPGTTDALTEGAVNKYYTDGRVSTHINSILNQAFGLPQLDAGGIIPINLLPANVARVAGDGGMEVGSYLDFHTVGDGLDYRGRLSIDAASNLTYQGNGGTGSITFSNGNLQCSGPDAALTLNGRDGSSSFVLYNLGDTFRIFNNIGNQDRFSSDSGGNTYIGGELWVSGGIVRFGANSSSTKFLWWDGGQFQLSGGQLNLTGQDLRAKDIYASRPDGTGVLWFGDGTHFLYWNGTNFALQGAELRVGGNQGIAARHLDPARASAGITISAAAPSGGSDGDIWFQV